MECYVLYREVRLGERVVERYLGKDFKPTSLLSRAKPYTRQEAEIKSRLFGNWQMKLVSIRNYAL
jgi:hypothetical protein